METPDIGALVGEIIAAARGAVSVAIPAQIVTFDPVTQTCAAKPTVSGRYQDPDSGALIPFPLPTVSNVPVAFPSASGFAITWPLSPGDHVLLVIADSSIDEWKTTGNAENIPVDVRRHDLTDAIAVPALRPLASPIPATGWAPGALVLEGADIRVGSAAATSPVALAPLVGAVLATLQEWLAAHVHAGVLAGAAVSGPPTVPPPAPGNVGAAKLKAE